MRIVRAIMHPQTDLPNVSRAVLLFSLLAGAVLGVTNAAEFFVAPDGSDAGPGTQANPFATLPRAAEAARHAAPGEPRRIVVRGGSYFNVALTLGPDDSGLVLESWPADPRPPVLYGGQPVTGWEKDGDRFWSAPGLRLTNGQPAQVRLLAVNGSLRPRARFPETNALPHLSRFDVPWMSTTGGGWKRPPTHAELTTLRYQPGLLPAGLKIHNAEVTVFHMWDESCVGVAANDAARGVLTLTPECGHPPGAFGVQKFVVWNTREGMTRPGQWFQDRVHGRLIYWPLPGEDMHRTIVIAPTTATILRLAGEPDRKINNVTVRGLHFRVTTVPLIAGGFAAGAFDGAISLEHAGNCRFEKLNVAMVAGHAIRAKGDVAGIRVEDCRIFQCGAGGIYVGGRRAVIANNRVSGVGLAYPSAVGIYEGGSDCVVSHNEVHDCSYSAINYGGARNVIEDNLLYDCMKVLHDGAAIYVFAADRCLIRRNVTRDLADRGGYPVCAYYLDERSTHCVVEQNLAVRVNWPSHNHMATNNVIRQNVFIAEGDIKLTFPRSREFALEQNVIYATGKIRIEGVNAIARWSRNLFYSGAGQIEAVELRDYSAIGQVSTAPGDTMVADPLFVDWSHGDYRFRPNSPTAKLGLPLVDFSHVGP
jgi:hypothetical protein